MLLGRSRKREKKEAHRKKKGERTPNHPRRGGLLPWGGGVGEGPRHGREKGKKVSEKNVGGGSLKEATPMRIQYKENHGEGGGKRRNHKRKTRQLRKEKGKWKNHSYGGGKGSMLSRVEKEPSAKGKRGGGVYAVGDYALLG